AVDERSMSRTAAILLAAGSSSRMAGAVADKVLAPLAGRPVFAHSAAAFMQSAIADLYVVVYRDQRQMMALSALAPTPSVLVRAYDRVKARRGHVTDDAQAVELLGHPIALLENSHPNPKLTMPGDLGHLEFLLQPPPDSRRGGTRSPFTT